MVANANANSRLPVVSVDTAEPGFSALACAYLPVCVVFRMEHGLTISSRFNGTARYAERRPCWRAFLTAAARDLTPSLR